MVSSSPSTRPTSFSRKRRPQLGAYPRQDGIEIVANFGVCESNDADAEPFNTLCPLGVVFGKPFMLFAIEFDRQLRRMAVKIDDETIKRDLSPELSSVKTRATQPLPEQVFRTRRMFPQSAGELMMFGGHRPRSKRRAPPSPGGRGVGGEGYGVGY